MILKGVPWIAGLAAFGGVLWMVDEQVKGGLSKAPPKTIMIALACAIGAWLLVSLVIAPMTSKGRNIGKPTPENWQPQRPPGR